MVVTAPYDEDAHVMQTIDPQYNIFIFIIKAPFSRLMNNYDITGLDEDIPLKLATTQEVIIIKAQGIAVE